jgi:uncharacterized RDD family membrane protein YckC
MELSYKIIGGDGREYGPSTLDDLQAWVREGRVSSETKIWRSDQNLWKRADDYLELGFDLHQTATRPRPVPPEIPALVRPAGFLPRLGAWFIDQVFLSLVSAVALSLLQVDVTPLNGLGLLELAKNPLFMKVQGVVFVVWAIYVIAFNGSLGATLGKMAIGARIIRLDGSTLGFARAALRLLAEVVSMLSFGVGYAFIAIRPDRRALHDLLAGTQVVYIR